MKTHQYRKSPGQWPNNCNPCLVCGLPHYDPQHTKLEYIDIRDTTGRASSLGIYGRNGNDALTVVGNLEHNAQVAPASVADADKLIAWLQEWKTLQTK